MFNLIRHVILKDNVVVNDIEYETAQTGCPEGLEDVIAFASDEGQIGWIFNNGVFTDPNPPMKIYMPLNANTSVEQLMVQLQTIQTQLLALQGI